MTLIVDVVRWFTDPAHYAGSDAVQTRVAEHLEISTLAVVLAVAVALPIGLFLGHAGRARAIAYGANILAVNVANIGRALPSLALLALALPVSFALHLGLGFWPTLMAMVPLAIPPILTNAYTGVRSVSPDAVEAARGMGMDELGILRRIELPLALPLIFAGMRTAAVSVVATATLGALVAGGGLGRFIVDGFALQEYDRLLAGALLVGLLAILVEVGFSAVERATLSPGIRMQEGAL